MAIAKSATVSDWPMGTVILVLPPTLREGAILVVIALEEFDALTNAKAVKVAVDCSGK